VWSTGPAAVAYVVSTWPRLWQTFVVREILAVDRLGVPVRIGSTKDPVASPATAVDSPSKSQPLSP
jgi:hypothetical protein